MELISDCPSCETITADLPTPGQIIPVLCVPCVEVPVTEVPPVKISLTQYCLSSYLNNLVRQKYCNNNPKGCS